MRESKEKFWLVVGLTIAAFAVRLIFLVASDFVIDADEAVVGLMARHIAHGLDFPVFYYGQPYMGSLEAFLTAVVFKVAGESPAALKTLPLILSTLLVPLTYALGRVFGLRFGARLAALFMALPPQMLIVWSLKARGGYIELLVIGALSLIMSVRILRELRPGRGLFFSLGAVLGLGFWTNFQIIYFIIVAGLVFLSRLLHPGSSRAEIRALFYRGILISGLGFILGSLPFWLYNLTHSFASFKFLANSTGGGLAANSAGLFETALPILLGARRVWQQSDVFPFASVLAGVIFAFILAAFAALRFGQIIEALTLRFDLKSPLELLLIFILASLLIFVLSSFGYLSIEPRYLIPVYLGLYVIVGAILERLRRMTRFGSAIFIIAICALNLLSVFYPAVAVPGEPFVAKKDRVSKDHSALISWLYENNISWIRTNYWIGYRLAFETGERVRFTIFDIPRDTRISDWAAQAERDESKVPFVVVTSQAEVLEAALKALLYDYKKADISGYRVFYGLSRPARGEELSPASFRLRAVSGESSLPNAVDGDINTRWGSSRHQEPGLWLTVEFKEPTAVTALSYEMGSWKTDYPRGLEIRAARPNGEQFIPLRAEDIAAVNYFRETKSSVELAFKGEKLKSLTLMLSGEDPVFDWSLAELKIFALRAKPETKNKKR